MNHAPAPVADEAAKRPLCLLALQQLAFPRHWQFRQHRTRTDRLGVDIANNSPKCRRIDLHRQSATAAPPSVDARAPPRTGFRASAIFHLHISGQSSGQQGAIFLVSGDSRPATAAETAAAAANKRGATNRAPPVQEGQRAAPRDAASWRGTFRARQPTATRGAHGHRRKGQSFRPGEARNHAACTRHTSGRATKHG